MTSMTNSESLEGGIEQSDWQERLDRFAQRLQLSRHDPISLLELRDDLERTVGLLPGGNPGFRLRALRLLAEASMQTGEYSAAFDVLVSALSIDDFADQDMRDSARMALVDAAIRSGRQADALALLETLKRSYENEVGTTLAAHNLLKSLGRRDEAIQLLERLVAEDHPASLGLAVAFHALGVILDETGRSSEALTMFSRASDALGSNSELQADLHNSKSVALQKIGRIDEAVKEADKAISLAQASGDMSTLAVAYLSRGNACQAGGQTALALQHFDHGLVVGGWSQSREHEITLLNNIALCYLELGQLALYSRYLLWALDVAEELDDKRAKALGLTNLATMSEPSEARVLLTEAYAIHLHLGDRAGQVGVLNQLAVAVGKDGYPEDALDYAKEALEIAQEVTDPQLLMLCYGQVGSLLAADAEPQLAWDSLMESLSWAEILRRETNVALVRLSMMAEVDSYIDEAIKLAAREADRHTDHVRQQWLSRLFSVLERFRARVLMDQMGSDGVIGEQALPSAPRAELSALTNHVRTLQGLLAMQDATGRYKEDRSVVAEELSSARRQLADFHAYLAQSNPRFGALSLVDPVDMDWLTAVVPRDVAIVEFTNVGDDLASLTYVNEELFFVRHGNTRDVKEVSGKFREACRSFADIQTTVDLGGQLGELVVRPILSETSFDQVRHLLIVPALDVFSVPLDGYRIDGAYLFERFSLSYLPSTSVAKQLRRGVRVGGALVIGDPDGSLPYARQEALEIGEVLHSLMEREVLVGGAATKDKFFRLAPTSQIIHIASHAIFTQEAPDFASIKLAGDKSSRERDLEVADIMQLQLVSAMVVLSGCDTGRGSADASNEMVGLVRSFLCAGASAVVATHWPIRDVSASEFMRTFYRYLIADEEDPAEALRHARADHIRLGGYTHPGHWAPYAYFGVPPGWS
jgi:CHAT domain-containing protein/tetratricopeptide (TPR) repeat protein